MSHQDSIWKLEHLSNAQLLDSLSGVLRTQRQSLAALVAHLGEVEDRRLHLEAAYGSMFSYCVAALGMSEDEACRRIALAQLARRFPGLFAELESGQITLSVALVLKPVLSPSNHLELLAAARGKCVRQARELVAERFPRPDAPSSIRKLPERPPPRISDPGKAWVPLPSAAASAPQQAGAASTLGGPASTSDLPAPSPPLPALTVPARPAPPAPTPSVPTATVSEPSPEYPEFALSSPAPEALERSATPVHGTAPPVSRSVIEPLSAQRYRIQFTADAVLKRQLEQARDLLRHAHPNGDFGPILSQALQLLIDDLMRHRFGARARRTSPRTTRARPAHTPSAGPTSAANADPSPAGANAAPSASENTAPPPAAEGPSPACPSTTGTSTAPRSRTSYIPRPARRALLERDALECSWTDAHGVRCGSQAWLEIDHQHPAGKGGSCDPTNLRLLCRAHNQLAAEHAYGREHIERARARRRETQPSLHPSAEGQAGRRTL